MFFLSGCPNRDIPLTDVPITQGGLSVAAYILVSMAVYGAMISSTAAGGAVAVERAQGWSRQLRLTPLNPVAYIAIKIIAGLVLGLVAVGATYLAGALSGIHHVGRAVAAVGARRLAARLAPCSRPSA